MKPVRLSRRQFLRGSASGAGVLASALTASAAQPQPKPHDSKGNPYAYPTPKPTVDPSLLRYEQASVIRCPRPEPKRIALDGKDNLLVLAGKYLTTLDATGANRGEITLPAPARCFAVAADGTIYAGMRDHVEVFSPSGQRLATWAAPAPRAWLSSLAVGEKEVYATDATTRVVWRFDLSGKVAGKIGEKDSRRKITGFVVPSPFFDLKLGRDGWLRVANPGQHRVETYTPAGELKASWGKPGTAIANFCGCCNPISFALFPDGRVVTCEKGLPRVKVYGAEGELEAVVARPEDFADGAAPAVDWSDHVTNGLDVAVDSRERIYILYWASAQVRVMTRKTST